VPRHVARLVTRLVVDYFASRRLVIDYFTYVARPVAAGRRAACRVTHRRLLRLAQARRRLLHLRSVSGCLGTSRGSSSTTSTTPRVRVPWHVARLVVDYFASRRLVVNYFTCTARSVASARRAACHVARRTARCGLLRLTQARRRLLRLRHASRCHGTLHGSSRRSPSTTSPTSRVRVPRHVALLITRLVVDYSVRRDFVSRQHWLCINYAARRRDVVFWSHRVDHSSRLVFQTSRER
jgi:hypothetical protein